MLLRFLFSQLCGCCLLLFSFPLGFCFCLKSLLSLCLPQESMLLCFLFSQLCSCCLLLFSFLCCSLLILSPLLVCSVLLPSPLGFLFRCCLSGGSGLPLLSALQNSISLSSVYRWLHWFWLISVEGTVVYDKVIARFR